MRENFLSCNTFPFAFNPENPLSRTAKWIDEKTLVTSFDMTVNNCPECAAVALILNDNIPKELTLKINSNGNMKPNIFVELKEGAGKIKYLEELAEENKEIGLTLKETTCEIVFTCWKSSNENFKGDVIITFE